MNIIVGKTIEETRLYVRSKKQEGKVVGFVPTMGALHEGHASLMRKAKTHCDVLVVSIFVNPTQFGPNEDFSRYPRTFEQDLETCQINGADFIFFPDVNEVYDKKSFITFSIDQLGDHLCGKSRPGHFNGVVQIVNKLFNIVKPDVALFGQKDMQQFRILEQMVKEFNHELKIIMGETVRAADGLALSSRNRYLSKEERMIAPALYQTLLRVRDQIVGGIKPSEAIAQSINDFEQSGVKTDYLEIVDYDSLQPAEHVSLGMTYVIAGAIFLGKTRLIDNVIFKL